MGIIELEHINKYYQMGENQLHVLKDVSLTVEKGDYLAILGPSGSGKSTLIKKIKEETRTRINTPRGDADHPAFVVTGRPVNYSFIEN